jgi:hypothetical protein
MRMIRLDNLQTHRWRRYGLAALTFVVLALFVSHPELRLLVPIIDAIGLDVLCVLCGAQMLSSCGSAFRLYGLPSLRRLYSGLLYFLGIAAPGVDAFVRSQVVSRLPPFAAA